MSNNSKLKGRECKFVFHLPAIRNIRRDTHVIKETVHYEDGSLEDKLTIVEDYKRPFWVTKEYYRRHKEKKESEDIKKLDVHHATQSDMYQAAVVRLGSRYAGVRDTRIIRDSPYLYGTDITSATSIKHRYMEKWPDLTSKYRLATFDIETDTIKNEIIIISISMHDKIYTVINKSLLNISLTSEQDCKKLTKKYGEQLNYLYDKYIPKTDITENIKREYIVVEDEMSCIKEVMRVAHIWGPDFIAIWNIDYDIPKMLDVCKRNNVDPKDIFSDPSLPDNLKSFRYIEGQKQKVTDSGKYKPVNPEEQWHWVNCPAKFWWIDAMSAHRYVRVGGKSVPGGYSLDNILKFELGSKLGKLKFDNEDGIYVGGIEWHQFMVAKRALEYIIYNQWDNISMLQLDDKTKDLQVVLPMLAGVSSFAIFNSGPKRIIDAMHFFYLTKGEVLATKPSRVEEKKSLGLGDWIVLLPAYRIKDNGMQIVEENPNLRTNIRSHDYDSDQVSGYPSDGLAANISKDTTLRELLGVEGMTVEKFRTSNIDLFFGSVNSLTYSEDMMKFPNMYLMDKEVKKRIGK